MPYNDYPASATRINVSNCGLYMKYFLPRLIVFTYITQCYPDSAHYKETF